MPDNTIEEKYLIIGGDSTIGTHLSLHLHQLNKQVITTTRRSSHVKPGQLFLDLSFPDDFQYDQYHYVFLCASITNMATCETNHGITFKINVNAIVKIAKKLLDQGSRIIFISSNAVFDGTQKQPNENAPYCAANQYGLQKMAAEQQLLSLGNRVTIVRITKLVAFHAGIFAIILEKLYANKPCEAFDNLLICPISIHYLCASLITIATANLNGIFHLSGDNDISYAEFSIQIANYLGLNSQLIRPTSATSLAFKPLYAGLGMHRTTNLLNILPESRHSLLSQLIANR